MNRRLWLAICATSLVACNPLEPIEGEMGVSVQRLQGAPAAGGTHLAFELLATDDLGNPLACTGATVDVTAEISFDGANGTYSPIENASVTTRCLGDTPLDVAMVLDNSGSQESALLETQEGARLFKDAVLDNGGRVSLVRVSTGSRVLQAVTDDDSELQPEIDDLFVNRGWTALFDGIRMANETLGSATATPSGIATDLETFCDADRGLAILAFTNGRDNNSGEEKLVPTSPDGIDTTLDDLKQLKVNGVQTPIHTVGLGERVDYPGLDELSTATGGKALALGPAKAVPDAFDLISKYYPNSMRVCAKTPAVGCGTAHVRVTYSYDTDSGTFEGNKEQVVNIPCAQVSAAGRSATILLTLSDPNIPETTAATLANNAVAWVAPNADPRVLVVRDDNHRGEDEGDTDFVHGLLKQAGVQSTRLDEPADGLDAAALSGYDVVWFSNPGWPMDDLSSFQALEAFLGDGGGVVLQGDDMSWSFGNSFDMSSITHLDHKNNGTKTCGEQTDDNAGKLYRVTFGPSSHPLTAGLEGASFEYGNDIDHSSVTQDGETLHATASLSSDPGCTVETPVVVSYDPN